MDPLLYARFYYKVTGQYNLEYNFFLSWGLTYILILKYDSVKLKFSNNIKCYITFLTHIKIFLE